MNNSKETKNEQKDAKIITLDQDKGRIHSLVASTLNPASNWYQKVGDEFLKKFSDMEQAREITRSYRSISGLLNWKSEFSENSIQFESSLERDFTLLALYSPNVERIRSQPLNIIYSNQFYERRSYTPDFEIITKTHPQKKHLVEVKYSDEIKLKHDEYTAKFKTIAEWCHNNGYTFHIVTDETIRSTRLNNIKLLMRYSLSKHQQFNDANKFEEICSVLPCSIKNILDKFSTTREEKAELQYHIWELLASWHLGIDIDTPVTTNSVIYEGYVPSNKTLFFD